MSRSIFSVVTYALLVLPLAAVLAAPSAPAVPTPGAPAPAAPTQWGRGQRLDADLHKNGRDIRALFADATGSVRPSIVRLEDRIGRRLALGTIVDADGWILTKASEVEDFARCELADGRSYPGRVVGVDREYDLALVQIEARDLEPIEWADEGPRVGQWVVTTGATDSVPLGLGVVSVPVREIPIRSGMLGVMLDMTRVRPTVSEVIEETAAAAAGLRTGDVILKVDGRSTLHRTALQTLIRSYRVGATVGLRVLRGADEIEVVVSLGPRDLTPDSELLAGDLSRLRSGFPQALQHDTTLQPNECGGPLLDIDGRAIAINAARASRTASYAIPASVVRELLPELKSGKLAPNAEHTTAAAAKPRSL